MPAVADINLRPVDIVLEQGREFDQVQHPGDGLGGERGRETVIQNVVSDDVNVDAVPAFELLDDFWHRGVVEDQISMGIPPNVVMKWTGHSSYRAMMPYIDIVDFAKAKSMAKFDKLL